MRGGGRGREGREGEGGEGREGEGREGRGRGRERGGGEERVCISASCTLFAHVYHTCVCPLETTL